MRDSMRRRWHLAAFTLRVRRKGVPSVLHYTVMPGLLPYFRPSSRLTVAVVGSVEREYRALISRREVKGGRLEYVYGGL